MSEWLRDIITILVILVPMVAVACWAGERYWEAPFKYQGVGFIAMGVIAWLGRKYHRLESMPRYGRLPVGTPDVRVWTFMVGLGVLFIALHYFLHRNDEKKG